MRAFIGLNWEESKMPRVYTTLLKVTRIRLRISLTDCVSLTSVCVAVADDAILTCSAEWPTRERSEGEALQRTKKFVKLAPREGRLQFHIAR